ncbi:MAG: hypothetical protein AB3N06_06755 [Erythrobacter sp.]
MASLIGGHDEGETYAEIEQRRSSDHESFLAHRAFFWAKLAAILALFVVATYLLVDVEPRHNGGSWYGYTLGTLGAGLIAWLAWLGIRKRRPTPGSWSLAGWTSAHVYLGLSLAVVGTMHTGFQLGWNVHTLAWVLMMLVILSGAYGVMVYATLPRALSENRRQMTREQMIESLSAIDRQLELAAQPLSREDTDVVVEALEQDVFGAGLVARLRGPGGQDATRRALAHISTGRAYDDDASDLAQQQVRSILGKRSSQIDQIRRQMRTKALLEIWLYIHVPLTFALLAALVAHIISVFYYW